MKLLAALILITLSSSAFARGPKHSFRDPALNDELDNIYKDISFPKIINGTASTMTVTFVSVSTTSVKQVRFKDGTTQITAGAASKWVQIVFGSATVTTNTTSTSYVDTNLAVTITPTSASNCILAIATSDGAISANAVAFNVFFTLANGTTNLNAANGGATATAIVASAIRFPVTVIAPQCPASVSAQTYKVRIKVEDAGVTGSFIAGSGTGRIWAIEYVP